MYVRRFYVKRIFLVSEEISDRNITLREAMDKK